MACSWSPTLSHALPLNNASNPSALPQIRLHCYRTWFFEKP